jgi:hypothetical protein
MFFVSAQSKLWVNLIFLFILALGYLGFKLTRGYIGGYLKADIAHRWKRTLYFVHGLGSLIIAMILPNNFLVKIDFIRGLYDQSGLWIAASIVTLLFAFLILLGAFFTFVTVKKT